MTDREIALFKGAIAMKNCVVEFGCGGSTFLLAQKASRKIYSVESDSAWIEKVLGNERLRESASQGRLHMIGANIGKTREWGYPLDNHLIRSWPNYWRSVWNDVSSTEVDCVFIDGRFRVACTLYALTKVNANATIIIHDFWSRPHYHVVLKYLNCMSSADDIAIFAINPSINLVELTEDLIDYAFNPD